MQLIRSHCTVIDSMSAIDYSKDSKFHGRTKHIEIKYHFVRNKKDEVMLHYLPTSEMVADLLTKPLALDLFKQHVKAMGLRDGDVTFYTHSFNINENSVILCSP